MNRNFIFMILIPLSLLVIGCPQPTDQTARDAIAAAHGWIVNAQATWGDSCRANNTQPKCVSTNKLIAAEHTAADALGAYCAGTPATGVTAYKDGGACVPITTAAGALTSAVNSMNAIVADVKSLLARPN